MQIIKEVCVDSLDDAINAEKNGANRIELCGRLDLDGLTPSKDLIKSAFSILKIPIRVMIRPKHPSFVYSEDEISTMIDDIKFCKNLGLDGVVFGCLDEEYNFEIGKGIILDEGEDVILISSGSIIMLIKLSKLSL